MGVMEEKGTEKVKAIEMEKEKGKETMVGKVMKEGKDMEIPALRQLALRQLALMQLVELVKMLKLVKLVKVKDLHYHPMEEMEVKLWKKKKE